MHTDCIILLKEIEQIPGQSDTDYIGVERGAYCLAKKGIPMVYAVGDFDSVTEEEKSYILMHAENAEVLNPVKDDSDSEHAVKLADQLGYKKMYVYGALGGRIDHEIVNLRLTVRYPNRLFLWDEENKIFCLKKGTYTFKKGEYKYFSLFTFDSCTVTLTGFAYPLYSRTLTCKDLYGVSNEIKDSKATLTVEEGIACIVQSN